MDTNFKVLAGPPPEPQFRCKHEGLSQALRELKATNHILVKCGDAKAVDSARSCMGYIRKQGQKDIHSRLIKENGKLHLYFYRLTTGAACEKRTTETP